MCAPSSRALCLRCPWGYLVSENRQRGHGVGEPQRLQLWVRNLGPIFLGPNPFFWNPKPSNPAPRPLKSNRRGTQLLRVWGLCAPSFMKGHVAIGGRRSGGGTLASF